MSWASGDIASEPAQLQDPEQPIIEEHTEEAYNSQMEADSGQVQRPSQPPEIRSPPSQSSHSSPTRTLDGHPNQGTPLWSLLGAGSRQRATADGEPAPRAPPRGAPIMPSIRGPISGPAPIPGADPAVGEGDAPVWVPLSTLGLKGPPFSQQLAAQGAPPGQRRTKQQRLETTFARAKARLQAMQEVRAIPAFCLGFISNLFLAQACESGNNNPLGPGLVLP